MYNYLLKHKTTITNTQKEIKTTLLRAFHVEAKKLVAKKMPDLVALNIEIRMNIKIAWIEGFLMKEMNKIVKNMFKIHDVIGDGRCCPGVMAFQMRKKYSVRGRVWRLQSPTFTGKRNY